MVITIPKSITHPMIFLRIVFTMFRMAKKKRKPGRPKSPKPKTARLTFVADQESAEKFHEAAAAEGMLFSEWVRKLCEDRSKEILGRP